MNGGGERRNPTGKKAKAGRNSFWKAQQMEATRGRATAGDRIGMHTGQKMGWPSKREVYGFNSGGSSEKNGGYHKRTDSVYGSG